MVTITGAVVLVVLVLGLLATKGGPSNRAPAVSSGATAGFDGVPLPPGTKAPGFSLTDQDGLHVSLSELRGEPVVIAFPYTKCGATCVVIAEQIRGALDELAHPVPVLLISADPQADTPAGMRRFLAQVSLSGRARYLTGSLKQLRRVWRAYRVTPASAGRQAYDRVVSVALIDGQGDERVLYGEEQLTPESLSHDIRRLQGEPADP